MPTPSFITPLNGDLALAEHVAQITEDLAGLRNIPISISGINDPSSFALTLRNAGAGGKGLQVLNAAGAAILSVQDSGISGTFGTLTSPHFTTPVVDSGGLTITLGGLRVAAGNVGLGAAPLANQGISTASLLLSGATAQHSFVAQGTGSSAATAEISGFWSQPATAAAAFTSTTVTSFHALSPTKGAGSTITTASGLLVDPITSGNQDNIGVDIGTPSGGSGLNLSLRASGAVRLSGLGARVAGDLYVIVDASGNLHKSAIGPAS